MSAAVTSVEARTDGVEVAHLRRAERYLAREFLWRRSKVERIAHCGRYMLSGAVGLRVSTDADGNRSAGFSNLEHCGSVWSCPVCSARINQTRSEVLAEALRRWDARGGKVCMVTLTVRHNAGQALKDVWDAVAKAWHAASSGATWDRAQSAFSSLSRSNGKPWIPFWRVFEVTHGINGWHVHVHALLFVDEAFSDDDAAEVGSIMWRRWDAAAQRAGMAGGEQGAGVESHLVTGDQAKDAMGRYFSKAVYEITGARFKTGAVHGNHRTPWGILSDLVACGDRRTRAARRDMQLWWEWEEASKGRRQMVRSRGLLGLLGMDEWEPTDQEIVDQEVGGVDVYLIGPDTWRWMCRRGGVVQLLEEAERSIHSVSNLLDGIAALAAADSPRTGDFPLIDTGPQLPPVRRGESGAPEHVRSLYQVAEWQTRLTL